MKVSIALHTEAPDENGNQRNAEARYRGYNRAYGVLVIDSTGNGVFNPETITFPVVQADADPLPYTHFSLGVCEGIDPGKGGAIIIVGELSAPLNLQTWEVGSAPRFDAGAGIYAARIAEMRADGRMGEGD